jgi:hypothetical protein
MSHQANFLGNHRESANLARTARMGAVGIGLLGGKLLRHGGQSAHARSLHGGRNEARHVLDFDCVNGSRILTR